LAGLKHSDYKKAFSKLRTSDDFQKRTLKRLEREQQFIDPHTKGETYMTTTNRKKQNKTFTWATGVAACAVLAVGVFAFNQSPDGAAPIPAPTNSIAEGQTPTSSSPQASGTTQAPPAAKGIVNIDGTIDEVSADGQSFRIGELWVTVTDATEYGIPGPNAPAPSEQLVSKDFKVGNAVSGYTSGDIASGKVTAERIYNNF
jgi:hypothetical protein